MNDELKALKKKMVGVGLLIFIGGAIVSELVVNLSRGNELTTQIIFLITFMYVGLLMIRAYLKRKKELLGDVIPNVKGSLDIVRGVKNIGFQLIVTICLAFVAYPLGLLVGDEILGFKLIYFPWVVFILGYSVYRI